MPQNVISIGGYASYIIDAKDISPLMAILERMTPVERRWFESGSAYVRCDDIRAVDIVRDSNPVISKADADERRKADDATREGRNAWEADTPLSANPYAGTDEPRAGYWANGWNARAAKAEA